MMSIAFKTAFSVPFPGRKPYWSSIKRFRETNPPHTAPTQTPYQALEEASEICTTN